MLILMNCYPRVKNILHFIAISGLTDLSSVKISLLARHICCFFFLSFMQITFEIVHRCIYTLAAISVLVTVYDVLSDSHKLPKCLCSINIRQLELCYCFGGQGMTSQHICKIVLLSLYSWTM